MPALAADIEAATRAFAYDTQSDAAVLAVHAGARDTGAAPRPANWDSLADAAAVNAAGFAFWKAARQRLAANVDAVLAMTGALDPSALAPTVTLVDAELGINGLFLIADFEIDLDASATALELIG